MIRRRRNVESWARPGSAVDKITEDLLECFGVGPAKCRLPDGFAHEVLEVLNSSSIDEYLALSRQSGSEQPEHVLT